MSLVPADAGRSCKGGFGTNAEAQEVAKKIHKKDTMLRVSRMMMVEDSDPRTHNAKVVLHGQPYNCEPSLFKGGNNERLGRESDGACYPMRLNLHEDVR